MDNFENDKALRYRSTGPEVFCKEGVLRNFAKFLRTPFFTGHLQ